MNFIVAVDEAWNIGNKGNLLTYVPEDLINFKKITLGHMVIMGRKTYESLPSRKPLPGRINIVLTRDKNLKAQGFTVCNTVNEVMEEIKKNKEEEPFIIGGAVIYELFLPYCQRGYITKLKGVYEADTQLFNLDANPEWQLKVQEPCSTSSKGATYQFTLYERKDSTI